MQIFRLFFSIFLFFALVSCEKELANDTSAANSPDELTDDIKRSALTVAEAREIEPGYWITVKGYIVAAAESSIKNADFKKPFAGKTAILLSDEPSDGTDEQEFTDLMPISLSGAAKGISASFNLQENADRWNNFVYVQGIRTQYMSTEGIKEVKNIWIGDPDEQPEPVVDPGNPNNPDNPDNPNNPNNPDNPNNPNNPNNPDNPDNPDDSGTEFINGNPVYTITQALSDDSLRDHDIWVKGYIIASAKKSMGSMVFEAPFNSDMAIILASAPVNEEDIQHIKDEKDYKGLFPVDLRSGNYAYAKNIANLKDHPENYNKLVYIRGYYQTTQVGQLGISPAFDAKFPPLQ